MNNQEGQSQETHLIRREPVDSRGVRLGPKVVQIDPKSYKSGTLLNQISVHFDQIYTELISEKVKVCHILSQSDPLLVQIW